jgi:hypothetical protein
MTGRRRKPGRMGSSIEGYWAWLAGRRCNPGTIVNMLAMAGGLGRWTDARGSASVTWTGRRSRSSATR